ncbi:MAG: endolytic transglycosylase MltG [Rhodomicrobium sp.]
MPRDVYNSKGDSRYSKQGTAYRGQRDYSILPRSPSEALEPERAPEPPRGSRQRPQHPLIVFFNRLMTFLLIVMICVAGLFYLIRRQFDLPGPLAYPTVFVVPRGEGVSAIARRLEQDGIINDRWTFFIASRYFKVYDKIKAGEYNIKVNASLRDVLDTLVEGKSILYGVAIPEGMTSYQIVERLKAHPDLVGDIAEIPAEGSLLPDTYRFARGTSREELIRRMQGEQKKFIEGLWPARSRELQGAKPEDVINIAAIVEKEASHADERPRVAAVYWNRLKKGMPLQADPTIIYGASSGKGTLGRPILRSELDDDDNPYNTYKNKGLPPTPIANPGRAAIEAALNPAKTSELYFVADGTGGHAFAESYADHQRNVAKWRHIEKEREDEAPAAANNGWGGATLDKLQAVDMPLPQRNPHR